ncbi:MAG: lipopolysaccharide biosynthesis protein [Paludibacteraceae bacterium]|nr:lipopolysaccharide biosynthesis protein [Paludibacteraceae bacterium]
MAEENLKSKTKKGLIWSALGNVANQGIRFVLGLVLARLLSPDAYGVIGMLTIFICVISIFIDCGFSQALIAKKDRTKIDFSTEFWFNVGVGILGYMVLFIISPFVADFYKMPILSPILKVIGLGVIVNSLCVVQSAQLSIRLDFKTSAKISVFSQCISGVVGIVFAYQGLGVWALVIQQLMGSIMNACCLWVIVRWMPSFEFSVESFRYLWRYGSKVLFSSLITQIHDNIYPLIIGKFYNSASLGLYSRAQAFAALPSSNIANVLGNVTFPVLCTVNDDKDRLASVYRNLVRLSAFIVFPLMLGMLVLSEPLVHVLLNAQWYDCILLLQVLCLAMVWQPISLVNLNLLKAAKRTDVLLKLDIVKRTIGLIILVVTCQVSVFAIAVGYAFLALFSVILNTVCTSRVLNVSFIMQMKDIVSIFLNSMVMACVVGSLSLFITNDYVLLFSGVVVGALYYFVSGNLFFKEEIQNVKYMLKKKVNKE